MAQSTDSFPTYGLIQMDPQLLKLGNLCIRKVNKVIKLSAEKKKKKFTLFIPPTGTWNSMGLQEQDGDRRDNRQPRGEHKERS